MCLFIIILNKILNKNLYKFKFIWKDTNIYEFGVSVFFQRVDEIKNVYIFLLLLLNIFSLIVIGII